MSSEALLKAEPEATTPAPGPAVRHWIPAVVVFGAVVVALLTTGVSVVDVARYLAYLALTVVLPGTLVYRSLRGRPFSLLEDLTAGAATGFVLELAAWFCFSAIGLQRWMWTWPVLVLVLFVVVRPLRRNWRLPEYQRLPLAWSWGLALVCLVVIAYLWVSYLAVTPLDPSGRYDYYQDLLYNLSLAGEAKNHFPLQLPQLAGEPLHYHMFSNIHLASASVISGVELPTVVLRLYLLPIVLTGILGLAAAGWRISKRPEVGVIAAMLTFAIGELDFSPSSNALFGSVFTFTAWASPSTVYSYVFLFPLAMLIAGRFENAGKWVLIGAFLIASGGAKSSSLPVLLAGVAVVVVVDTIRQRRVPWSFVAVGAGIATVQLIAGMVLLGGQAYGIAVDPFRAITSLPLAAGLVPVFGLWALALFVRLAGIGVVLWQDRWRIGSAELFLLGSLLGGIAAALLFAHPGGSQVYFLKAGWPLGAILSAWGLVRLVDKRQPSRRLVLSTLGGLAVVSAIMLVLSPRFAVRSLRDAVEPLAVLAVIGFAVAIGWFLLRGQRKTGVVIALIAVVGVGAANLPIKVRPYAVGLANGTLPSTSPTGVSADMIAAAQWVRGNSSNDDIVATNVHCRNLTADGLRGPRCLSVSFWVSAFTERRVLIESWGYTNRIVGTATSGGVRYNEQPFWDQELLDANDIVFTAPTQTRVDLLRDRHHVRWLVADRRLPVSPELAQFARLRFQNQDAAVYELAL